MNNIVKRAALTKLAFYGYAGVSGSPSFITPQPTVGQMLYAAKQPFSMNSQKQQRQISNSIVNSGINVNKPANSLLRAGIGALAGNFIANTLGTGPFMRGVLTAAGANYGYNK